MTNAEVDKLNEAISTLVEVCDKYVHCYNCPMRHNCSATCLSRWEEIPYDRK